ncbi:MYXO-CTERM sorting domain-containing protein [Sandaracinus amylolyticus]|nr:MYXO-CTERM sorting domain-containing protein [Sandaracinus amylolyticus]
METPFEQLAAEADAIFEGRVASIEPAGEMHVRVRLDVVQTWREANAEHVEVRTASQSAACGVHFEVGRSYLVLAERADGEWTASLCGGTRAMEDADDERLSLGSGVIPGRHRGRRDRVHGAASADAPAARGGCAGCAITSPAGSPIAPAIALVIAMWMRRRRIR